MWIKKTVKSEPHECNPPLRQPRRDVTTPEGVTRNIAIGRPKPPCELGDLWGCEVCGTVWEAAIVVLPSVRTKYRNTRTGPGWKRAGWWKQRKYGPRYGCGCRIGGPRTCDKRYAGVTSGVVPVHGVPAVAQTVNEVRGAEIAGGWIDEATHYDNNREDRA